MATDIETGFRPLELELGLKLRSTAGYHDLESIKLKAGHEGATMVGFHELVHDQMLRQTPFGTIVIVLKLIQAHSRDQLVRIAAEQWLIHLVQTSRRSHECAATYLSIKTFAPEAQGELLDSLPVTYREYFETLAQHIDPVIKASFAQYLVGKAIMQMVFASRLAIRLREWSPDLPISIYVDESPDQRLDGLLPAVSSKLEMLGAILAHQAADGAVVPKDFDIQSELAWRQIPLRKRIGLETQTIGKIRDWLFPLAAEVSPTIPEAERLSVMSDLFTKVLQRYVEVDILPQQSAEQLGPSSMYVPLTAIEVGGPIDDSLFPYLDDRTNPMAIFTERPERQLTVAEGLEPEPKIVEVMPMKVVISSSALGDDLKDSIWYRLESDGTTIFRGDKLSFEMLQTGLRARTMLASLGAPIPTLDALVVGLNSNDLVAAQKVIDSIINGYRVQKGGALFDTNEIIWYMNGDVRVWYEALASGGQAEVYWYYPNTPTYQTPPDENSDVPDDLGVMWFIVRQPPAPGIFFRVLSWLGAHPVLTKADSDRKIGLVRFPPEDERPQIANQLLKALQAIRLTWQDI